mmetsp:Transcript_17994/g.68204  ORF Transcript_17994/g.68204 Transcript_17994/m.68204 type:complete len:326 (-) Transcript_17994:934-1911(-)
MLSRSSRSSMLSTSMALRCGGPSGKSSALLVLFLSISQAAPLLSCISLRRLLLGIPQPPSSRRPANVICCVARAFVGARRLVEPRVHSNLPLKVRCHNHLRLQTFLSIGLQAVRLHHAEGGRRRNEAGVTDDALLRVRRPEVLVAHVPVLLLQEPGRFPRQRVPDDHVAVLGSTDDVLPVFADARPNQQLRVSHPLVLRNLREVVHVEVSEPRVVGGDQHVELTAGRALRRVRQRGVLHELDSRDLGAIAMLSLSILTLDLGEVAQAAGVVEVEHKNLAVHQARHHPVARRRELRRDGHVVRLRPLLHALGLDAPEAQLAIPAPR